jgi:hypothetical protein
MMINELLARHAVVLAERPWLRPFIESGDVDLEAAEKRWEDCQRRSRLALRARGVELHRRVRGRNGLSTTALAIETEKEER